MLLLVQTRSERRPYQQKKHCTEPLRAAISAMAAMAAVDHRTSPQLWLLIASEVGALRGETATSRRAIPNITLKCKVIDLLICIM